MTSHAGRTDGAWWRQALAGSAGDTIAAIWTDLLTLFAFGSLALAF